MFKISRKNCCGLDAPTIFGIFTSVIESHRGISEKNGENRDMSAFFRCLGLYVRLKTC